MKQRVILYGRVSSEEQRERCTIDMQTDYAERWCAEREIELAGIFLDEDVSSGLFLHERPAGGRLVAELPALRKQGVSQVILYRWDRLGRKPWVVWDAIFKIEQDAGLRLRSMTQEADTSTPERVLMLCIDTGVSNYERETIIQRSMDASNMLARRGVYLGGVIPYGYQVVGERREARLAPSDTLVAAVGLTEAEVVGRIYQMVADERATCYAVAVWLNQNGVLPHYARDGREVRKGQRVERTAGAWTPSRVRNLVASTSYKGIHTYGKRTKRAREVIERELPALVDPDLWERAQHAMKLNRTFKDRTGPSRYLLRGLIRCGLCGLSFGGASYESKKGPRFYYTCNGKSGFRGPHKNTGDRCRARAVHGSIEDVVWGDVERFLRQPGAALERFAEQQADHAVTANALQERLATIRLRLEQSGAQRAQVISWCRTGLITEADLERQLADLVRERANWQEEAARLERQLELNRAAEADRHGAEQLLRELGERLETAPSWEAKRAVIEQLVDQIIVETVETEQGSEAVVTIHYRFTPASTCTGTRACESWGVTRQIDVDDLLERRSSRRKDDE